MEKQQAPEVLEINPGERLGFIEYKGQQVWIAKEVCDYLGIKNPTQAIQGAGLEENIGYISISGEQLTMLKITGYVENRASSALFLTIEGLLALAANSRKPPARALIRSVIYGLNPSGRIHTPPASVAQWRSMLRIFDKAFGGSKWHQWYLLQSGWTEDGGCPDAFSGRPPLEVHAQLLDLAEQHNPHAIYLLEHRLGLPAPTGPQTSLLTS